MIRANIVAFTQPTKTPPMHCQDIDQGLHLYLDGEFDAPERDAFEAHLRQCPPCRQRTETQSRFWRQFREKLDTPPPAPSLDALHARLSAALDAEDLKNPPTRARKPRSLPHALFSNLGASVALAAIIMLSLGYPLGWYATRPEAPSAVLNEALATHRDSLPMEVRGSERHIRAYLEAVVPFSVEIPRFRDDRIELVGARLTRVNGQDAVLLKYRMGDERLSLLQTPAPASEPQHDLPPTFAERAGFEIATYKRRGLISSVVGTPHSEGIRQILEVAYPVAPEVSVKTR